MKNIALLIGIISLFCLQAKAQPVAGNGCMSKTSPNRVFQEYLGTYNSKAAYKGYGTSYSEWTVQYDITDYPCFQWTQVTASGCYIKTASGSSSSTYTLGNYGYFTGSSGVNCPIDYYALPLAMIIGGVSFHRIRKKRVDVSEK